MHWVNQVGTEYHLQNGRTDWLTELLDVNYFGYSICNRYTFSSISD